MEREALRSREKHALNLAEFKRRWPTIASDDQARIDSAWFDLTFAEGEDAIAGIAPFSARLKADGRSKFPAGWKYLGEKRWTLLAQSPATSAGPSVYAADSAEAKAIKVLHDIAGRSSAFWKIWRRPDGTVSFPKPMTPQLLALADAPSQEAWITLDRNGGGSWENLLQQFFEPAIARARMREGSKAPWPFAPSKEGKIYTTTGPPETLMSEQDMADFKA